MHNKLIFDENGITQSVLEDGFSDGVANMQELSYLAKYYRSCGAGKKRIESILLDFCKNHDKDFDEINALNMIDMCVNSAMKYKLRSVSPIIITVGEIDSIKKVKDFKKQKFLFCMLVYAKALKFSGVRRDQSTGELKDYGYYVSNTFLEEIRTVTGINESYDTVLFWLHDYRKLDLIRATSRESIKLSFGEFQGIPAFVVDTEKDMVQRYIDYCGGELIYCEKCNKEIFNSKRNTKMCQECSAESKKESKRRWANN